MRLARSRPAARRLIGAVAFVASLGAAGIPGCGRNAAQAQASWTLVPAKPALDRPTRVQITLAESGGGPIADARLQIEGHMNHPGMAPVVVPALERRPGVYEADLHFTMAGPWVLVATGTTKDGRRITHTLDVPGVGP